MVEWQTYSELNLLHVNLKLKLNIFKKKKKSQTNLFSIFYKHMLACHKSFIYNIKLGCKELCFPPLIICLFIAIP